MYTYLNSWWKIILFAAIFSWMVNVYQFLALQAIRYHWTRCKCCFGKEDKSAENCSFKNLVFLVLLTTVSTLCYIFLTIFIWREYLFRISYFKHTGFLFQNAAWNVTSLIYVYETHFSHYR